MNPASGVTIVSSSTSTFTDADGHENEKILAVGKSVKNKAVVSDAFGKPSNTKVTWSLEVTSDSASVTSQILSKKLITLSTSGAISAKKGIANYLSSHVKAKVTATTTDGTNLSDTVTYYVVPLTTKVTLAPVINGNPDYWYENTALRCPIVRNEADSNNYTYYLFAIWAYGGVQDFTIKSSNPNVATGRIYCDDDGNPVIIDDGYVLEVYAASNGKKGSATITVTATDGSNKKAKVTVTVK